MRRSRGRSFVRTAGGAGIAGITEYDTLAKLATGMGSAAVGEIAILKGDGPGLANAVGIWRKISASVWVPLDSIRWDNATAIPWAVIDSKTSSTVYEVTSYGLPASGDRLMTWDRSGATELDTDQSYTLSGTTLTLSSAPSTDPVAGDAFYHAPLTSSQITLGSAGDIQPQADSLAALGTSDQDAVNTGLYAVRAAGAGHDKAALIENCMSAIDLATLKSDVLIQLVDWVFSSTSTSEFAGIGVYDGDTDGVIFAGEIGNGRAYAAAYNDSAAGAAILTGGAAGQIQSRWIPDTTAAALYATAAGVDSVGGGTEAMTTAADADKLALYVGPATSDVAIHVRGSKFTFGAGAS